MTRVVARNGQPRIDLLVTPTPPLTDEEWPSAKSSKKVRAALWRRVPVAMLENAPTWGDLV